MTIKTIGLELELFATRNGEYCLASGVVPSDACGYLAEARGEPRSCPVDAKHMLYAEVERIRKSASEKGIELALENTATIPKETLRVWLRKFGKSSARSFFMGGHVYRNNAPRAGLHVHFGNSTTFKDKEGATYTTSEQMNMPRIIALLDKEFKEEIKAAKRMPGEYELKAHGFEYRSLPATTDLDKLTDFLDNLISHE